MRRIVVRPVSSEPARRAERTRAAGDGARQECRTYASQKIDESSRTSTTVDVRTRTLSLRIEEFSSDSGRVARPPDFAAPG